MAAKHLFTANEVGLFEKLAESPANLDELARRAGIPRRTMRIIVDAMVALGLVERHDDRYQNGPVAAIYLSGRTPADLRPALKYWNRLNYQRWTQFERAVRTDTAVFGEFEFEEEEQRLYTEGVEAITAGTAQALATTYDFNQHRRLMDLGGGTGSFLTPILRQYRDLEATLYELPSVALLARRRLAGDPITARVQVREGDFFKDDLPNDHDAVLLCNVCHNFLPERNLQLLRRIRDFVPTDARLLIVDFWTDSTHTQPLTAALMAGTFLLTSRGDVYSEDDVRCWLDETGWHGLERKSLAGPASLIVAETAPI